MSDNQTSNVSWDKWWTAQQSLRAELSAKAEGSLRFRRRFVNASTLAQQFFCEKKVEMSQIHGRVETPQMAVGTAGHEKIGEDARKRTAEQIWADVLAGKPIRYVEPLLIAKHQDQFIRGRPDLITFEKARPHFLFEYKFSAKPVPSNHHHVQAGIYCYMLESMGFPTDKLRYVLAILPPDSKGSDEIKTIPRQFLRDQSDPRLSVALPQGNAELFQYPYDRDRLLADLNWALEFWKQEREAKPTKMAWKCRCCEFRSICESSLTR